MKEFYLLISFICLLTNIALSQNAWINEFHYDNTVTDVGEFVEIVIENPGSYTLSDFQVDLYNGSGGASYDVETVDNFTVGNTEGNYTFYYWDLPQDGIQNGAPDGLSLSYLGTVITGQFLSYEGSFIAVGGPADGVTSTDIGVSETSSTPVGYSLELGGTGTQYSDFTWNAPAAETKGTINNGQTFGASSTPTITVIPTSLSGFTYVVGNGPSISQSYYLSGANLDGSDVTITAPSDYEISLDDANWSSPITLTAFDGTSTTVYVRLKAGLSAGFYNSETISNSGGGATTQDVTCNGTVNPILPDLVINEILADPDATLGDANGDGNVNTSDDEFVEIINNETSSVDISGWTISDAVSVRHTFPASTLIPAGESVVVFGGGTPTGIPGTVQIASSGALGLNNAGDDVILKNGSGFIVVSYTYGSEGGNNQSLARDPDITGAFVEHSTISSNPVSFSPGRKNTDGSALPVELTSFSASVISSKVKLSWTTATEVNNFGFNILRQAQDDKVWEKI